MSVSKDFSASASKRWSGAAAHVRDGGCSAVERARMSTEAVELCRAPYYNGVS